MKPFYLQLFLLVALTTPTTSTTNEAYRFPKPLSKKVKKIYQKVFTTALLSPHRSGIPAELIGTSGKLGKQIAEYGSVATHCEKLFYPAMKEAKEEILFTTYLYDRNSPCADLIKKALIELNQERKGNGKKLRVYMVLSTMSTVLFWNKPSIKIPNPVDFIIPLRKADPTRFDLPSADQLPNLDFQVKTFHKGFFGAIHSKLIIVDGRTVIIGSKNVDEFEGFEYANRVEGAVANTARADFEDAWKEPLPPAPKTTITRARNGEYSLLYLPRTTSHRIFDINEDNPQDQAWLKAMDVAQNHVFIFTPSFNCKTFFDKVIETVRRGIFVTMITNFKYEDTIHKIYPENVGDNIKTVQDIYKRLDDDEVAERLNICYFLGSRVQPPKPDEVELSHVKFMSVDDEFYIYGSGNHDAQSWHHSREVNLLVDDPKKTVQVREYLMARQNSLKYCFRDEHGSSHVGNVDPWRSG